ncbi:hypothetical protein ACROYT_G011005 [Oculina patagonica]
MAKDASKTILILKIVCALFALLSLALLIALIVVVSKDKTEPEKNGSSSGVKDFCPETTKLTSSPARSSGLYDDLSKDEIIAVRDYILYKSSLNVTSYEDAAINNNYIYLIELQQPPKDEALNFLDNADNAPKPERKARVVIFFGGQIKPVLREYLVSPVGKPIKHEETTGPGQKYPIPFYSRPPGGKEYDFVEHIVINVTKQAYDLLNESYDGYTYSGCTDRCLEWADSAPGAFGLRKKWFWFLRRLQGIFVHPVGFEIYLNTEGSDVSLWKVEKVFYYNQSFNSVEELMQAYNNGSIYKVFLPAPSSSSNAPLYSSYLRRGKPQPPTPLRPPQLVEPDGKRYTVSGHHVEYMKWSFDFRSRSSTGVQLFDIRFDGQRIVYELSLQEAAAFYSGWSPMQMLTDYLDTAWGMGSSKFELVPGVDCPSTATFFDAVHFVSSSEPAMYINALCLFELNLELPLRRHFDNNFDGGYNFYGGMPGSA